MLQEQETDRRSDVSGSELSFGGGFGHVKSANANASDGQVHTHKKANLVDSFDAPLSPVEMLNHSYSKLSDSYGSPHSQPIFPDPSSGIVLILTVSAHLLTIRCLSIPH